MKVSTISVKLELNNVNSISDRILNSDNVGMFVATTWHRYFNVFTPMKSGTLRDNVSYEPFKITYNSPYAHYIWEGKKYIDPKINASGWFDAEQGRWFSHKDVKKVPTEDNLNYTKDYNPKATSHWEQAAYDAYKDTVANQISAYIRSL